MTPFRVSFFNVIPDSTGHDHRCCQRIVDIPAAADADDAEERAKREFERLEGVHHWRIHASALECEISD